MGWPNHQVRLGLVACMFVILATAVLFQWKGDSASQEQLQLPAGQVVDRTPPARTMRPKPEPEPAASGSSSSEDALDGVRVEVDNQLDLQLDSRSAADIALDRARRAFGFMEFDNGARFYPTDPAERPEYRVVSVIATHASEIDQVEAEWRGGPNNYGQRAVWVVRIEGPFRFERGLAAKRFEANSALFIVDDSTGEILAWGIP